MLMATIKSCHVTVNTRSDVQDRLIFRHCFVLVFTIVLTSLVWPSMGVRDVRDLPEEEHIPTLKEIFGGVPQNSIPLMHRHSPGSAIRSQEARTFKSGSDTSFKIATSLRRGLRRKSPRDIEGQVTDGGAAGFSPYLVEQSVYYVKLQLGTPVQDALLLIDTGSPIFWVQSIQCTSCEPELLPSYNASSSSTFEAEIANGSLVPWSASYGSGSVNYGIVVRDTIFIDSGYGDRIVIPDFEFGLVYNSTGFTVSSGILGLGQLALEVTPFLTQLGTIDNGAYSKYSRSFRYCFTDRVNQADATSFLSFGDIDETETNSLYSSGKHLYLKKTLWTRIIPNRLGFYALNLTAISIIGVTRINIEPAELTLEAVSNGTETILDSGTVFTHLRDPYYSQFVLAYYNATVNLGGTLTDDVENGGILYYNITKDEFDATVFPSVSFIFQKWQPQGVYVEEEIEVFQQKDNLIFPLSTNEDSSDPIYVLNMVQTPAGAGINILGNFHQQNLLIQFDLEKSRVGFLRASCAFEY